MLKIDHFSKSYNGIRKAVDDLSLHVQAGDIYGFIGHNGAGKTTTLKAVAGILDFAEGSIEIDGVSLKENPVKCKAMTAYMPDNPDLYDYLNGIQYLNFIGDIFRVPKEIREERISKYADLLDITIKLGDPVSSYSHGMKQKLSFIAAFIHDPKLLILDEPFVGLDPKAAHIIKGLMQEACANGAAVFFSTHVLDVAEKICNKIAIIKDGRLIADGETAQVKGDQSLEDVFLELIEHE